MNFTVDIVYLGVPMTVTGDFSPLESAVVYAPAEDCHPEEGGEFEIESITIGGVDCTEMFGPLERYQSDYSGSYRFYCTLEIADLAWEKANSELSEGDWP